MSTPDTLSAYSGLPAVQSIPTNMREAGVMAPDSSAVNCFVNQQFSQKLQAFMISYVNMTFSNYSIYAL